MNVNMFKSIHHNHIIDKKYWENIVRTKGILKEPISLTPFYVIADFILRGSSSLLESMSVMIKISIGT